MNSAELYFLRLLFWKYGIFHSLANAKLQRGLGWNLDRFAGSGVSAFTGFSLGFHELSDIAAFRNAFPTGAQCGEHPFDFVGWLRRAFD